MKEAKALTAPDLEECCAGMRKIVAVLMDYRMAEAAAAGAPRKFKLISAAEFLKTDHKVVEERDVIDSPVDYFAKKGIKRIGQMIYDRAGMKALRHEVEEISDDKLVPGGWGRKIAMLDSALDGVGSGNDRWWS